MLIPFASMCDTSWLQLLVGLDSLNEGNCPVRIELRTLISHVLMNSYQLVIILWVKPNLLYLYK